MKVEYTYICASYSKAVVSGEHACLRHFISHAHAEEIVQQYLRDAGHYLHDLTTSTASMSRVLFVNTVVGPIRQMMAAVKQMRMRLDISDEQRGIPVDVLIERFAVKYAQEHPSIEKKLDVLQKEHDQLTNNLLRLPPSAARAIVKAQQRIVAVEAQINEVERLLEDVGERCLAAMNLQLERLRAWDQARTVLAEDSLGRARAEAVSKVIKGVYFWFRQTGRKRPATEIDSYRVVPVGGDDNDGQGGDGGKPPPGPENGAAAEYPCVTTLMRCGTSM